MTSSVRFLLVFGATLIISGILWGSGYAIAPDRQSFLLDRAWLYQILWLPLHILCAHLSIFIYARVCRECNVNQTSGASSISVLLPLVGKKLLMAGLIVSPFLIMDGFEGYYRLIDNFESMGYSSLILLAIWTIEWFSTGVLWIYSLFTLKLTIDYYNDDFVEKNIDNLLLTNKTSPLLIAGVENSLVIVIYALSTFGYILFAGGEFSDLITLVFSGLFVLAAFLGSVFHLRTKLNRALDRQFDRGLKQFTEKKIDMNLKSTSSLNLESINALDHFIFSKPAGISAQSYARLRFARMQALSDAHVDSSLSIYQQIFRQTEYELRLSLIGIAEVRTVFLRLAGPAVGVMAKAGVVT
jgi:uncharacterized membrane protein YciS (DUF1049 family)